MAVNVVTSAWCDNDCLAVSLIVILYSYNSSSNVWP